LGDTPSTNHYIIVGLDACWGRNPAEVARANETLRTGDKRAVG
jgi:hypothetical protein